jgi:pimeloyl-ACP methyl ester carboxylesterase
MTKHEGTKSVATPLRVYLSHAREDQEKVKDLYRILSDDGFEPWLDDEQLLPGSDWHSVIKRAIRTTDVFLCCMSQASTSRGGFYLKELEYALDVAEEQPKDNIFIIPVRLEPCPIPDRLNRLTYVDLFAPAGYERLHRALKARAGTSGTGSAKNEPLRTEAAPTARVVVATHGIRTRGKWQKDLAPLLSRKGFTPVLPDYGYFLLLQLVTPRSRRKKVDWFRDEYTRVCKDQGCDRPSIVGHSFGTYLIARSMEIYPEIKFDRVILCGAIVRRDYDWGAHAERGQIHKVLNQYGGLDIWARLVEWVVKDAGQSGLLGFEKAHAALIEQGRPEFRHSDYFYALNFTDTWLPFLEGAEPKATVQLAHARRNWRFAVLKWIVLALLVVVAIPIFTDSPKKIIDQVKSVGLWLNKGPTAGDSPLEQLQDLSALLQESSRIFISQNDQAKRLLQMLRENHPGEVPEDVGYDEVFFRMYDRFNSDEATLQKIIRSTTINSQRRVNQAMSTWLKGNVTLKAPNQTNPQRARLSEQLRILELHLNQWHDKYEALIPDNQKRSLVYLADEERHGVGFPEGLEDLVNEIIRSHQ